MLGTGRATVNGTTLAWREAGAGEPLLLLHGFPFDSRLWEPQLAALPAGWRGIAPDLRGFGGSEAGGVPLTMEQHARDTLALLDHLGLDRAVVCGLSMGGYCALALHRIGAGRVRALVLCDTKAEPDSAEARRQRAAQVAQVRERGSGELVAMLLRRLVAPATLHGRPAVVGKLERMMRDTAADTLIEALHGLASRPDARPQLPGIRVPALVLGGALDEVTPPEVMRDLAAAIPGASLRLLPDAGHASNLEAADAFNAELHAFLAALGTSG
jgi:pimeloyl-ACP methyl ester carboxylesterase